MPTEAELREQFHHDDRTPGSGAGSDRIDLDAVLRRSRARRRPRVAALAIASSLAVAGVVVPVSISVASSQTGFFSAGSSASAPDLSGRAPQSAAGGASGGVEPAPAERINLCGSRLAAPAPAEDGLVLTVQAVDARAGDRDIPVTVTLTNTGTRAVAGSLSPFPNIVFSRDGIVLWHSNGAVASIAQEIDMAPGASTTFASTFEPLVCGAVDDEQLSFRTGLPAAGPGDYELSATLDLTPQTPGADGQVAAVLVSGPTTPVTLH